MLENKKISCRSKLGEDLVFVVLVMGEDEVRRRMMERHGDEDTVRQLMVSVAQPVVSFASFLF